MQIIPSTYFPNTYEIEYSLPQDSLNLEDGYKFFISESVKYLNTSCDEKEALDFLLILSCATSGTSRTTIFDRDAANVEKVKELWRNLSILGTPNASEYYHTKGTVNLNTFLAAYVCLVNLYEKYIKSIDNFSLIKSCAPYLFLDYTRYIYQTDYSSTINGHYKVCLNIADDWRIKRLQSTIVDNLDMLLKEFEGEIYNKIFKTGLPTSCLYNNISDKDLLLKAFNVGMFTYNIGKTGISYFYRTNRTQNVNRFLTYLSENPDVLKVFMEKVFLYPSPNNTALYKQLFTLDSQEGLFTENKISSDEFCLYMKTRGHPVNTKTARLLLSFAGVFDDPLNFDHYLTKFLFTTREESRGKQLLDGIKQSIDICTRRNKALEEKRQEEIRLQIGVFQHLVRLGQTIMLRSNYEKYLYTKDRRELLNQQFSRGEKGNLNVGVVEKVS